MIRDHLGDLRFKQRRSPRPGAAWSARSAATARASTREDPEQDRRGSRRTEWGIAGSAASASAICLRDPPVLTTRSSLAVGRRQSHIHSTCHEPATERCRTVRTIAASLSISEGAARPTPPREARRRFRGASTRRSSCTPRSGDRSSPVDGGRGDARPPARGSRPARRATGPDARGAGWRRDRSRGVSNGDRGAVRIATGRSYQRGGSPLEGDGVAVDFEERRAGSARSTTHGR